MQTVAYSYKELKEVYVSTKQFLEKYSNNTSIDLNSKIEADLRLWGDENYYLLVDFIIKYKLDFSLFNYNKFFQSESELHLIKYIIKKVLKAPVLILNHLLVKHISQFYFLKLNQFIYPIFKQKKDLTTGDLVMSRLKGKFSLRNNYRVNYL